MARRPEHVNLVKLKAMLLVLKKGASRQEMKLLEKKVEQLPAGKRMKARKYSGTIRLAEDPLTIQKKLRDEWE